MAKTHIGLDIGPEDVKIVCLETIENGYKLSGYGFFSFGGDAQKLSNFIKGSSIPSGEIRINIEDPSLKIRRIDLPQMTEDEIDEAVKWGMKDVIDGNVEDFSFNYIKIDESDLKLSGKLPLIVFALKTSSIEQRERFIREVGIRSPKVIEPNASALASIFEHSYGPNRDKPVAIIDIGRLFSVFTVIGRKGLVFSRPLTACTVNNLTEQIVRDLGINTEQAKELRRKYFQHDMIDESFKTRLENTISQYFSRVAIEVQRSLDGFSLVFGKQKIIDVYLCGGGSLYSGLPEYLKQTVGGDFTVFDPFVKIDTNQFSPGPFDTKKTLFAVAAGLAVD